MRSYAAGRDIAIGCELEPDLPAIAGDHDRLIQVLTNLVSNAVKFSPTGGRVLVHAARTGGELTIAVRDWGVGIRSSDHGRLFQRFQRLHPGSRDEPGTGLGLAISKAIVDRHGGRITVESVEAEGSTFTVVLPLARADEGAAPSASAVATDAARPTILLIDDDVDFGTVLEVSLGAEYRFLRVERGVQALDVARAERPDLVLLDVVLPDLSGYDVLRILQHSEATRRIPVVMLTVQPERMLARGLGAADVVAKPVDIEELRHVIDHALARVSDAPGLRVALGPLPSRHSAALVAALEAGGHAVFLADDPWDLVRCADEHHPDVAVVEIGATGAERTLAFLRGHATTRRLPLVLLSGEVSGPLAAGCVSVAPSANDDELVRRVEEAAGRSRQRRGRRGLSASRASPEPAPVARRDERRHALAGRAAAFLHQPLNRPPGELARGRVAVLPTIDGGDGDGDRVRELFLRQAEADPQLANGLRSRGAARRAWVTLAVHVSLSSARARCRRVYHGAAMAGSNPRATPPALQNAGSAIVACGRTGSSASNANCVTHLPLP